MRIIYATLLAMLISIVGSAQSSSANTNPTGNNHLGWDDPGNAPLWINQNNIQRMRFHGENYTGINGTPFNNSNRITLGITSGFDMQNTRFSLLNMGRDIDADLERNWMNVGTTMGFNADIMYTGIMEMPNGTYGTGTSFVNDAVVAWGCNDDSFEPIKGPDNLRFIFISPTDAGGSAAIQQGREVLRITPRGNVGIGDFAPTANGLNSQAAARLDIYNDNDPNSTVVMEPSGNGTAVRVRHIAPLSSSSTGIDVSASSTPSALFNTGVKSNSFSGRNNLAGDFMAEGSINGGTIYGLKSHALVTTPTTVSMYGIHTETTGTANFSYALYAKQNASGLSNHWGAYICGRGYISGGAWQTSDESLKENIEDLTNGMDQLMQLNPKTYNFIEEMQGELGLSSGLQHGLLAGQLSEVFPQYVTSADRPEKTDEEGNVIEEGIEFQAVNYMPLIPLLIQGVKEQQATIDALDQRISELEALLGNVDIDKTSGWTTAAPKEGYALLQNRPNPFDELTEIGWRMADEAQARIVIQDSQGNEVAVLHDASCSKGLHSIDWNATGLPDGIYYCSLLVDGQLYVKKAMKIQR